MSKIPLHLIMSRLRRMKLDDQLDLLVKLVAAEKPYSVRRNELMSLLQGKRSKQIKRDIKLSQKAA
jgi:hypothetical protein